MTERILSCSDCAVLACKVKAEEKYPKFCVTKNLNPEVAQAARERYDEADINKMAVTSAIAEAESYCKLTRVEETVEFIKRMGYKKVGVATCMGLIREAKLFAEILGAAGIDYFTACCKIGAVDKEEIGVPADKKLNGGCAHESMCNPILQAKAIAAQGCDFVVMLGLCVGHDTMFLSENKLPCTVLAVKDRVNIHNPMAALYAIGSPYSRFKDLIGK